MLNILDTFDLIVGAVENSQVFERIETFDFSQSVVANVELLELFTTVQVFDFRDSVRLQTQYRQIGQV